MSPWILSLPVVAVGCGGGYLPPSRYVATDGQEFVDASGGADARLMALQASGAHDLACSPAKVQARVLGTDRSKPEYAAEGCGRRALYVAARQNVGAPAGVGAIYDCTLTSIVSLSPAP